MKDRVFIAGAGPAGLSAAAYLTSQGIPISIFEAEKSLPKEFKSFYISSSNFGSSRTLWCNSKLN